MASLRNVGENKVNIVGECSINGTAALRQELESLIRDASGGKVELGFSELTSVNSAILSLMLCCSRVAKERSCELSMTGLSRQLYDMARVGGLESILPLNNAN